MDKTNTLICTQRYTRLCEAWFADKYVQLSAVFVSFINKRKKATLNFIRL